MTAPRGRPMTEGLSDSFQVQLETSPGGKDRADA